MQQQILVANRAEESALLAEIMIDNPPVNPKDLYESSGFYPAENNPDLKDQQTWENGFSDVDGNSQYIIHYLGEKIAAGDDIGVGANNKMQDTYNIYKVATRSTNSNDASKTIQTIYLSENKPE